MATRTSRKADKATATKSGETIHGREVAAKEVDEESKHVQTDESSTTDKFKKSQDDDTQGFTSISQLKGILTDPANISQARLMNEPRPSNQPKQKEDDPTTMDPGLVAGVVVAVVIACIFTVVFISTPEPEMKSEPEMKREPEMKSDFDLVTIFENGVDELQESFTNQTERFWMIVKNRGLAHLRNKHPSQPLVFLLAAPPPAHKWVDCLATKLAENLDPKHKRNRATIDGNKEKGNPADKTKEKMDEILQEKFKAGHRVAVIHHLELLPPPSPLLFYSYCDDQNAPYKHVTIIFTVNLPEEPSSSLSPNEAEGIVEEYLENKVWSTVDKDAVSALLSRIATTVALMNGESSNSLKDFCS